MTGSHVGQCHKRVGWEIPSLDKALADDGENSATEKC